MPIVSPSPEELHAYQDEEPADEELLTDELRSIPHSRRRRHLLEHYENFATGFSSQSLLFIYVGLTYWSTNTIIASPRQSSIWISGMLDCLVKFKCSSL